MAHVTWPRYSPRCKSRRPKQPIRSTLWCAAGGRVPSVLAMLEELVQAALQQAFPGASDRALVGPCRDAKFGDYQCNNAMSLFGKLKGKVREA